MTVKRAQRLHAEGRKPDSDALTGRITASGHQALENAERAPRRSSDDRSGSLTNPKASEKAKPMTKTEVCKELATNSGLEPKQVAAVFAALKRLIQQQLCKKGPGLFVIPNLVMFKLVKKAATEARSVPNPFKPGEMLEIQGKPARVQVKLRILKGLQNL
jgi:nucleoid DNA-binding protein